MRAVHTCFLGPEASPGNPGSPPLRQCRAVPPLRRGLLSRAVHAARAAQVPSTNYIFMGDFVDRGFNSLEVRGQLWGMEHACKAGILGWD